MDASKPKTETVELPSGRVVEVPVVESRSLGLYWPRVTHMDSHGLPRVEPYGA